MPKQANLGIKMKMRTRMRFTWKSLGSKVQTATLNINNCFNASTCVCIYKDKNSDNFVWKCKRKCASDVRFFRPLCNIPKIVKFGT